MLVAERPVKAASQKSCRLDENRERRGFIAFRSESLHRSIRDIVNVDVSRSAGHGEGAQLYLTDQSGITFARVSGLPLASRLAHLCQYGTAKDAMRIGKRLDHLEVVVIPGHDQFDRLSCSLDGTGELF